MEFIPFSEMKWLKFGKGNGRGGKE